MDRPALTLPRIIYRIETRIYVNLTSRCSLRCRFCPKFSGTRQSDWHRLRLTRRTEPHSDAILRALREAGPCDEVVFCGFGEPTVRLAQVLVIGATLRTQGVHVRLNTDGLANLRCGRDITPQLKGSVDTVSVSLNAQNAQLYDHYCRPTKAHSYQAMLAFCRGAVHAGIDVVMSAIAGLEHIDVAACHRQSLAIGARFKARPLDDIDLRL